MSDEEKIRDIKKHLNIDFDDDDAYLLTLLKAAEQAISSYVNRPMTDFQDAEGDMEPAVLHAVRLLAGTWYANRESVSYGSPSDIPYTLGFILTPLKRFVTPETEEETK